MNAYGLSSAGLVNENRAFAGTGGVSSANRHLGLRPGFIDRDSGRIFLSRFADGRVAGFHLLDGLPAELTEREPNGRVRSAKASITSGFVLDDRFYTRDEAARMVENEDCIV